MMILSIISMTILFMVLMMVLSGFYTSNTLIYNLNDDLVYDPNDDLIYDLKDDLIYDRNDDLIYGVDDDLVRVLHFRYSYL